MTDAALTYDVLRDLRMLHGKHVHPDLVGAHILHEESRVWLVVTICDHLGAPRVERTVPEGHRPS